MKKTIILSIVAIASVFAACNQVKQATTINVDIPYSQQFSVPQVAGDTVGVALPAGGVTLPFPDVPLATNSQQYISQYGTAVNLITDVDIKSLTLQITSPATQNFDFMDSIEVYISAPSQSEQLVGYEYGIPKGATTLNINTMTSINLKNYFVLDTIYFRLSTHINAVPATGTAFNMASVFNLQASPLN